MTIAPDLDPLAVPIEQLDTMPGNPRKGDVDAIARSYSKFGQRKPIVARRTDDGRGVVIAGNHQLQAARQLGWDRIAVVWVDDDDQTAAAFALADNRLGDLGSYDDELLADLVLLVRDDAELIAATGFDDAAIARLLDEIEPGDTSPQLDGVVHRIIVECTDELHQAELLDRFEREGLTVRALMA